MRDNVIDRLQARFQAYAELVDAIEETAIPERLDSPKHKSLGEHLWCVIGARESYAKGLVDGEWSGFSCSMDKFELPDFREKLSASAQAVAEAIKGVEDWTEARDSLLADLAEHEVMHEGQIIRHVYGLERELPKSWKWA